MGANPKLPTSTILLLPLLLLPSMVYLWWNADIPQFGDPHDDAVYYVSAKALATGGGYRIPSLPGEPWQTKYPPLYPLLLSFAWRIDPHFPENLRIAAWLSWLAIPAMLLLLAMYYPRIGISDGRAKVLLGLLAINPYVIWIGSHLHSELFFLALTLGALLLVERAADEDAGPVLALAAGAMAGLAYLARSAGIVMLASAPVFLVLRHARRQAWYFAAAMLPFIVGWTAWANLHQLKTSDPALLYYTNYLGPMLRNVLHTGLPRLVWKNVDELLLGMGSLIIPKITDLFLARMICQALAVGMIVGVVRMARRGQGLHYALYAAGTALLLLIWHYPPNERFVLPLFPLALAGLMAEMEWLGAGLRRAFHQRDTGQRVAAVVIASVGVVILGGAVALQLYLDGVAMPQGNRDERETNADDRAAFGWIRANLPESSLIFSIEDPALFLFTGHHAISQPVQPVSWYHDDHAGALDQFRSLVPYARQHGISYVYFARCYPRQWISEPDRVAMEDSIRSSPDLIPVFRKGISTVYQVRPD